MQVHGCYECFSLGESTLQYQYTKILFKRGNEFFFACQQQRATSPSDVDLNSLTNLILIPFSSYCPALPPGCTQSTCPLSDNCYIKRPNLIGYNEDSKIKNNVLREITACEILRQHPHRNIAQYHGCEVDNGHVTGLCFKKYRNSLHDKLNPHNLNKIAFQKSQRPPSADALRYLRSIEAGLRHLHSLGLSHNDLNPANVMLDQEDEPVIIDFDSCLSNGTGLGMTKRTYGWHDEEIQISQFNNDYEALSELRSWLIGSSPEDFRFKV